MILGLSVASHTAKSCGSSSKRDGTVLLKCTPLGGHSLMYRGRSGR